MGLFFVLKSKLLAEKAAHESTLTNMTSYQEEVYNYRRIMANLAIVLNCPHDSVDVAKAAEVLRTDYASVVADLHKTLDENSELALALANRPYQPTKKPKKKLAKKK